MFTYDFFTNLDGEPVERTKRDYPYSYDEFVHWLGDYDKTKSNTVHSDRLYSWDNEKYDKFCLDVWGNKGQYFSSRAPEEIEKFLSLYMDKKIKLTAILEACNTSNGYPYWTFCYE